MSKLSATLSMAIALIVGVVLSHQLWTKPPGCDNPTPDDGNPVGLHITSKQLAILPSGSPSTNAQLTTCTTNKTCQVQIDLGMSSSGPPPVASKCPSGTGACFQITGQAQVSSVDWQKKPHPQTGTQPRYVALTVYVSDK